MRAKKAGPLTAARADVAEICRALGFLLVEPGAVVELRVPNTRKGTVSGYFTDYAKLAAEAAAWSGQAPGVAITVNPVAPEAEPGTTAWGPVSRVRTAANRYGRWQSCTRSRTSRRRS